MHADKVQLCVSLQDLKWCLKFMVALLDRQTMPVVSLQREDPAARP